VMSSSTCEPDLYPVPEYMIGSAALHVDPQETVRVGLAAGDVFAAGVGNAKTTAKSRASKVVCLIARCYFQYLWEQALQRLQFDAGL
jgi:hypothetical protein